MTLPSPKTHRFARLARTVLVLVAGVFVAVSVAAPADAAKNTPCGKKVLNDWWDNGRVDRLYPLHCYEDAIDGIPADIRDYSDAEEVLTRALQAAVRGKLATGGSDPSPQDNSGTRDPFGPVKPGDGGNDGGGRPVAAPDVEGGTSSLPIPLLVLGGMSLALLAAGGFGYLSRRRQTACALDGEGDPLDPHS
ncbi:MAG: hypothetical protein H0U46_11830 [Actinobacteria bacterium]|nr:hypothetical protein [Actinomycetota bacterium]